MALSLGKQIGPLPAGGWVAVIAGGLVIGYFINRRQGNPTEDTDTALTDTGVAQYPGVGVGGGQLTYDPPQNVAPEIDRTNVQWGVQAENYLVSLGMPATEAANAVRKYLSAEVLTAKETGMINLALRQFGALPEPISSVPDQTPATPTEGLPPSVFNFRLNTRASRRNIISWHHSGQNVAYFHVLAITASTGAYTTHVVTARKGAHTSYTYTHELLGSYTMKNRPKFYYLVRAFNSAGQPEAGPGKKIGPYQHLL